MLEVRVYIKWRKCYYSKGGFSINVFYIFIASILHLLYSSSHAECI